MRLIGVCLDPQKLCIVLELCERGTLQDILVHEPMTMGSGLMTILSQVASGLVYLHSKRYVHLDVKSANVLIRQDYS